MSVYKELKNLSDEDMLELCDNFTSASDYLRSIGMSNNGRYVNLLNTKRRELELEWKLAEYRITEQVCPVCSVKFKPGSRKQTTCSYACSNTYFRSGKNNGQYIHGNNVKGAEPVEYRRLCFSVHPKECIICGEDKVVAVHHYDENHENNDIENLVPMCPTHHQYMHSKYKNLIQDQVLDWFNINKL